MPFIGYMNKPLCTLNAKAADRAMIEKALSSVGGLQWNAPEQESNPPPARRCPPAQKRPQIRRQNRLKTDEVLAIVGPITLAQLMDTDAKYFDRWGVLVPRRYEAWLRSLLEQWPTINQILTRLSAGASPKTIAKELGKHVSTLSPICAEFGIKGWLND